MEVKPLEVYSEVSNYGIVRMPGCVIQGDTLSALCQNARRVVDAVLAQGVEDEELLGDLERLHNALVGRLLDYQAVLGSEGLTLPYARPLTQHDLVQLTPNDEAPE